MSFASERASRRGAIRIDDVVKFYEADGARMLAVDRCSFDLPAGEFCVACYTGKYPSPVESEMDKFIMEQHRARTRRPVSDLVHDDTQRRLL